MPKSRVDEFDHKDVIEFYRLHSIRATCNYFGFGHSTLDRICKINGYKKSKEEVNKTKELMLLDKYGVKNAYNIEKIKNKAFSDDSLAKRKDTYKKTIRNKYGVDNYFQTDECKRKIKNTCLDRYGVEYTGQAEIKKEKTAKTNLKRYGDTCYFNTDDFNSKARKKFEYGGVKFDSKPELAFWIWANDNNEYVVREPVRLDFIYKGKVRHYKPDFLYNGILIEIKSSNNFDKDGVLIDIYHKRKYDELYLKKHGCALANNVVYYTEECYNKYIKYVEDTYGKDYLDKFRKR